MDPDPENIEDMEGRCENAVFEVCDVREHLPRRCAGELGRYLKIKNNIATKPVVLKQSPQTFEIPPKPDIEETGTSEDGSNVHHTQGNRAEQLQGMINKIHELKVALKQLEDNRNFEIKHLLK